MKTQFLKSSDGKWTLQNKSGHEFIIRLGVLYSENPEKTKVAISFIFFAWQFTIGYPK